MQRHVPKFLQQYTHLLAKAPRKAPEDDEEPTVLKQAGAAGDSDAEEEEEGGGIEAVGETL